ncbi:set and mynd domain containing arthropod-specific member 4 isoform a [Holotrichia oblita]|uniref:Set and mynd domain containing arthropod-specific member 4 isoform a n=1 Tax=Holotrichia oblita TaxID=644536 RepID=A0ACB9SNB2_HOLOL|nr:set and mynd domain containing arthropod-specific member 4 isoform a [Holotrichia oblita]
MVVHFCSVCKKPSVQSCSLCYRAYYCSKEHQIQDWKKGHKNNCAPFKIAINEVLGRHLISTCDIPEGSVILQRKPLVICPKIVSLLLCLGCHKKLNNGDLNACSKCNWPVCGMGCENTELHKDECELLSQNNIRPQINLGSPKQSCYALIAPLRSLLLKEKSKSKFEALMNMQSNLENHRDSALYLALKQNIVPIIIDKLKIDTNEEEILTICSIFDTNAFDVRDSKGLVNVRALYSTVSLISHDCKQNTRHYYIDDDFEIHVSATIPIKKGEIITTSYTQTLWGTILRRKHLKQFKNFDCTCNRCKDPTEFGLYVGSIYCSSCRENDKSNCCPKMISTDSINSNANFKCENCDHVIAAKQVHWGNEALRNEILSLNKSDPKSFEAFLEKYKDVLHSTNTHVLEVKYALSQMYGNLNGYNICDIADDLVERKITLCHELLEVADILCPGSSRFRGSLLYDLQAAMVVQTRRSYEQEKITKQAASERLLEAVTILQESAKILSVEPDMKDLLEKRLETLSNYLDLD